MLKYSFILQKSSFVSIVIRAYHRFCIIGSGPAGFYAAQHLLKLTPESRVDIFEKLPVPFGLVRYGVAPDHPEVKNVINTFNAVLQHPNVTFIGNFDAERDVPFDKLREAYHAIVLAHGAGEDRKLHIPGEDKVLSAREFVGWYNGLPENRELPINLENCSRAVIIGQGNVALDIARMLLSPIPLLEKTDISGYALEGLKRSGIREVLIIGRRGPLQVSFTIKELRELVNLEGVEAIVEREDFKGIDDKFLEGLPRPKRRLTELMLKVANNSKDPSESFKSWRLKFLRSPKGVAQVGSRLTLTLQVNRVDAGGRLVTAADGEVETEELVECDVIFRSVGYKGRRIFKELPFNEESGIIPNVGGKIQDGVYCCGWAAHTPKGVILSTMQGSFEVAKVILQDMEAAAAAAEHHKDGKKKGGFETLRPFLLQEKRFTSYEDFLKIAEYEKSHGTKVTSVEEMFAIVNGRSGGSR